MIRKSVISIALGILILASALSIPAFAEISSITSTATITDESGGFTQLDGAAGITTVVIGSDTYALVASNVDDGVQIIKITTPSSPTPVADGFIVEGTNSFTELKGAFDITTVVIGGTTYALVASSTDRGVQIIDISTPSSPTAVAAITDGVGGFTTLLGAGSITTVVIGSNTYALVAGQTDNGIQIIDISTPSSPTPVADGFIVDGTNGFTQLSGVSGITTVVIGGTTYALAASFFDDGVQIIDISTPSSPTPVADGFIVDETNGFTELDGAKSITTVVIGGTTYAVVAAQADSGVQIIDISTPSSPTAVAAITDGVGGFTELALAISITTVVVGSNTYALVASLFDDGVQIIDITTPSSPTAAFARTDGTGLFTELDGALSVTTVTIGSTTYALVSSTDDDGVQIFSLDTPPTPTTITINKNIVNDNGGTLSISNVTLQLKNDNITQIIVGAPGDDDGFSAAGAIWNLFLNTTLMEY